MPLHDFEPAKLGSACGLAAAMLMDTEPWTALAQKHWASLSPSRRAECKRTAVNLGRAEEAASDPSFLPRLSFASLVDLLTLPSLPTYSKCLKM